MAPGTLFVVATPIGNLEDITLRALRILREAGVVAAEDTRRTGNLLRHYDIKTPLLSLHEHNERQRIPQLLKRLVGGGSVALVSDAGTPGISDPGVQLVQAARDAGVHVTPIPGPSSVIAAISAAGLPTERFAFAGFPPVRLKDRTRWFDWVSSLQDTAILFFEAPHRVRKTLAECAVCLVNRPIIVARELTKIHEEWRTGSAEELLRHFAAPQGEFVFIVLPPETLPDSRGATVGDAEVLALFGQITENDRGTRRDAVRQVAERLGLSPKQVYDAIERVKISGI